MHLRDWRIEVKVPREAEDGDKALARCHPVFGRRYATITFNPEFETLDQPEQRDTVAHELVHVHLAAIQSQVENDLERILNDDADAMFFRNARRNLEYGVDALAGVIAPTLPRMRWPK